MSHRSWQNGIDAIASGTPLAVRVYVLSVNHMDRHKFGSQHRLHTAVYQDFNAATPRYTVKGHLPHTQTNRQDPAESRLACVRAMQSKFKRVTVLCKDDGTEAKIYVLDLTPEMMAYKDIINEAFDLNVRWYKGGWRTESRSNTCTSLELFQAPIDRLKSFLNLRVH